jgi:hypothetical protein
MVRREYEDEVPAGGDAGRRSDMRGGSDGRASSWFQRSAPVRVNAIAYTPSVLWAPRYTVPSPPTTGAAR